ncbi:MAG: hypothetical protein AAF570_08020, partial [Bacteroidota bacterium]
MLALSDGENLHKLDQETAILFKKLILKGRDSWWEADESKFYSFLLGKLDLVIGLVPAGKDQQKLDQLENIADDIRFSDYNIRKKFGDDHFKVAHYVQSFMPD